MTYYFGIPHEFKNDFSGSPSMLAFEVYGSREDLYETHLNSGPMLAFLPAAGAIMSIGLDLTHYEDRSGFLDRSVNYKEAEIFYDTRITTKSAAATTTLLEKLAKLAKYVDDNEEGAYTFLVVKSLDSEDEIRIFERYESWDAFQKHLASKELADLLLGSKEEIKSLEGRTYVPNQKGWLHR
jgi:quinol monooxygenase YgiN